MNHPGSFFCSDCRRWLPRAPPGSSTTGYGIKRNGRKSCFACCGLADARTMREQGRIVLYAGEGKLTNWPGTLTIPLPMGSTRVGRHNVARVRVDYWFTFEGETWHGVRFGDSTDLVHCKRSAARKVAS